MTIDGVAATPLNLPAHGAVARAYTSGAGKPSTGGKSTLCVSVSDTQNGQLNLGWLPPAVIGDGHFVNVGAQKADESGYSDVAVTVRWTA
ncbi:hypothetical protein AKI39_20370 [Bordetella sp. H567]|nr:hypothetical protein AKI39_20370 [Bordetella sp. H567]